VALVCALAADSADAQVIETAGSRALGMGGAFVAVASDSSATWWNPAGIAAGPFVDIAWARSVTERVEELPAARDRASWFAVATPPAAFGYYRLRITDIQPFDPTTDDPSGSREDRRAGVPVRSLSASQLGVTLARTLSPGVHTGTTLKYIRGTLRHGREDSLASPTDLLALGDDYASGDAQGRFDLDVGLLAVAGSIRLGAVVKNVREPEFEAPGLTPDAPPTRLMMPRQMRIGVAFDPANATGVPLTVAFDADIRTYATSSGERRMVALGVEHWFFTRRVGVRAGGRKNTRGEGEMGATAGLTIALRGGLYLDGHLVRSRNVDEQGWGLAARISF
jgi:F plasmid transfer operon, TraF, protein